jgi:hypothetical protein
MAKTKEGFDWIMPLVLILFIVVSWLFGLVSSKLKKRTQGVAQSPDKSKEDNLMDMILGKGQETPPEQPPTEQGPYGPASGMPRPARMRQPPPGGPVVTPKPIEPKWWGA